MVHNHTLVYAFSFKLVGNIRYLYLNWKNIIRINGIYWYRTTHLFCFYAFVCVCVCVQDSWKLEVKKEKVKSRLHRLFFFPAVGSLGRKKVMGRRRFLVEAKGRFIKRGWWLESLGALVRGSQLSDGGAKSLVSRISSL